MGTKFKGIDQEYCDKNCFAVDGKAIAYDAIDSAYTVGTRSYVNPHALDDDMYDKSNSSSYYSYEAAAHIRGYFTLARPVLNYVLAGNNAARLAAILGISSKTAQDICGFRKIYVELSDGSKGLYGVNDLRNGITGEASIIDESIKVGAEYFQMLVDNFDPSQAIVDFVNTHMKRAVLTLVPGEGKEAVYSGIYLDTGVLPLERWNEIRLEFYGKGDSTLAQLLALKEAGVDKAREILNSCIFHEIVIVPKNIRPIPTVANLQHDPLDVLYANAYNANIDIASIKYVNFSTITQFIAKYAILDKYVCSLTYKRAARDKLNKQPIFDKIKAKKGFIRAYCLGKRQDFSGRSVITIDPFLSMTRIKVPKRMIPFIYRYHLLKAYAEDSSPSISYNDLVDDNPSDSVVDRIVQYAINKRIIADPKSSATNYSTVAPTIPTVIGRQPTLHKGSIAAFEVMPSDGNSIALSPLIVPGFNADFDGDTMYGTVPLEDKAIKEAKTILLHKNNMFWSKDGAPLITPRQEIIYGLSCCTKPAPAGAHISSNTFDGAGGRGSTEAQMNEEAYNKIVENKCRVYDELNGVTYGVRAIRHCMQGALSDLHVNESYPIYTAVCSNCGEQFEVIKEESCICPKCNMPGYKFMKRIAQTCSICGETKDLFSDTDTSNQNNVFVTDIRKSLTTTKEMVKKELKPIIEVIKGVNEFLSNLSLIIRHDLDNSFMWNAYKNYSMIIQNIGNLEASANQSRASKDAYLCAKTGILLHDIVWALGIQKDIEDNMHISDLFWLKTLLIGKKHSAMDKVADTCKTIYESSSNALVSNMTSIYSGPHTCPTCNFTAVNAAQNIYNFTITKKTIGYIVRRLLIADPTFNTFVKSMDLFTKLGFRVAKYYAPTLDVLKKVDFSKEFDEFHKRIEKQQEYYEAGLMEEDQFAREYAAQFKELEKAIAKGTSQTESLRAQLTPENGFLQMADSGARGNMDNLTQMYAYKGLIKRDNGESFNAVIENPYISQLNPLEHFMVSYGSRRGIMDRSLETQHTGYMSRQMWHATHSYVIVTEDCGTKEGIEISKEAFSNMEQKNLEGTISKILLGRYLVGSAKAVTKEKARTLAFNIVNRGMSVRMRSPLTCKNPCCQKCYGIDMSTHADVVVGTPVGIIAAEAIGETTSQLTMRTFQGGGVAGTGTITKTADLATDLFHMSGVNETDDFNYSPLAWEDGEVIHSDDDYVYIRSEMAQVLTVPAGTKVPREVEADVVFGTGPNGEEYKFSASGEVQCRQFANGQMELWIGSQARKCKLNALIPLKHTVKKGQALCEGQQFKFTLDELLENCSYDKVQFYYLTKLYELYASFDISFKHFEILIDSMSKALVLNKPDDKKYAKLHIGEAYSKAELIKLGCYDDPRVELRWELVSIKNVPLLSSNAVAGIDFERIAEGLFADIIFGKEENFDDPIESLTFSKAPKVGSNINPDYIKQRTSCKISEEYY